MKNNTQEDPSSNTMFIVQIIILLGLSRLVHADKTFIKFGMVEVIYI